MDDATVQRSSCNPSPAEDKCRQPADLHHDGGRPRGALTTGNSRTGFKSHKYKDVYSGTVTLRI